jgi:hypothetical protein
MKWRATFTPRTRFDGAAGMTKGCVDLLNATSMARRGLVK